MTRYFTRVRRRRLYAWHGRPTIKDRKMLNLRYGGLVIKSGDTENIIVTPGDIILIEGDDDERPLVAKLLELYDDGSEKHSNKHAVVQWFLRYEEVPYKKRTLLGREPHPQEIFLYDVTNCENDIDAETIIGTVKVLQLKAEESFPVQKELRDILYVKLSWNGRAFKPLTSSSLSKDQESTSSYQQTRSKSLPQPCIYPLEGDTAENRLITRSASKSQRKEAEVESRHSASKSSHSKERRNPRMPCGTSTPGARKKLQLSSPTKSLNPGYDKQTIVLDDDDFKSLEPTTSKRKVAFSGIPDSPPKTVLSEAESVWSASIAPLGSIQNGTASRHSLRSLRNTLQTAVSSQTEDQRSDKILTEVKSERKSAKNVERTAKSKTPQKLEATPKKSLFQTSNRSEEEHSVADPQTPRSQRRAALKSASQVRQQLKILLDSDIEDDMDKDFVLIKETCVLSSSEGESEEEVISPKKVKRGTPTSSRKSAARTPNKTLTSRTPHSATPRIPERSQPVRKPGSVLEEARIRLHVSAVPESLPCREQEFQDVYNFVESKLLDGTGGCMYISGVPGTGKTATVHEVIRSLQQTVEEEELPTFQYIEINGMKLTDPHQAFVQILKLLTGQKATAEHAAALLEKMFSTPVSKRETTVLLVDELDLLWTRKQNVMYSLFDWPTRKQAKLIVLAIANTMDLPERIMMNRVASRLGLTRMSFQPYTHKQLQQIITSRLNHIKAFDDDAIQLVSRKVAALSGDARRCLDICRRATEICEFSCKKGDCSLVKMPHVMEALDEMFSSPYVIAIRSSSVLEQAFLRAVIAEFRRSGLEEATFQQPNMETEFQRTLLLLLLCLNPNMVKESLHPLSAVRYFKRHGQLMNAFKQSYCLKFPRDAEKIYRQHIALCRIEGIQPPSMSETMAVCLRLGASRLLLVESSRNDLHLRVRINVSQDDIMYALKEA